MIVPVIINNRRGDLEQLKKDVAQIKEAIPRKSEYQKEMDALQDACLRYESVVKELTNKLERSLSLNDELVQYIDNLDEIKRSGGVRIFADRYHDFRNPKITEVKIITIPEVKISVLC